MLFDRFNLSEDIFDILFATAQQKLVGKLLIMYIKENEGEITKKEMSLLATALHEGKYLFSGELINLPAKEVKIKYNKRQFYDRILTPSKSMGLIDYDLWIRELRKPSLKLKKK